MPRGRVSSLPRWPCGRAGHTAAPARARPAPHRRKPHQRRTGTGWAARSAGRGTHRSARRRARPRCGAAASRRSVARSMVSRAAFCEVTSSMPSSASGNSPSRQPRGTLRALASVVLGFAAAGELRDCGQFAGRRRGRPAGRAADIAPMTWLSVSRPRPPAACSVSAARTGPGPHRVRGPVLGEHLAAQPVRAQHRGQLHKVDIGGVAEADGGGRALDLPLLGDPRPARVQVRDVGGHLRVAVPVILRHPGRHARGLVPRRTDGRRLLAVWPGTGERVFGHYATPFE